MGYETRLRTDFVNLCSEQGWLAYVMHADPASGVGRSDVFFCAEGRFGAVEMKTVTGSVRPRQPEHIRKVRRAGGIAFIARDPHLAVRAIKFLLQRKVIVTETESVELEDLNWILENLKDPNAAAVPTALTAEGPGPDVTARVEDIEIPELPPLDDDVMIGQTHEPVYPSPQILPGLPLTPEQIEALDRIEGGYERIVDEGELSPFEFSVLRHLDQISTSLAQLVVLMSTVVEAPPAPPEPKKRQTRRKKDDGNGAEDPAAAPA